MLIDDGNAGRPSRVNLFNPNFASAGLAKSECEKGSTLVVEFRSDIDKAVETQHH